MDAEKWCSDGSLGDKRVECGCGLASPMSYGTREIMHMGERSLPSLRSPFPQVCGASIRSQHRRLLWRVCKCWGWTTFGAETKGAGASIPSPSLGPLPLLALLPPHLQLLASPRDPHCRPICIIAGAATSTQRPHHGHAHHVPSHLGVLPPTVRSGPSRRRMRLPAEITLRNLPRGSRFRRRMRR